MTQPRSILALDTATFTAFAHWREGEDVCTWGHVDFGEFVGSRRVIHEYGKWLSRKIRATGTNELAYELPFVNPKQINNALGLYRLSGVTEFIAKNAGCTPVMGYTPDQWRATFLGKSRPSTREPLKKMAVWAAKARDFHVTFEDEAEAIGILTHHAIKQGIQLPWDRLPLELAARR